LGCEKPEAFAGIAASGLEAGAPIEIRGHDMVANYTNCSLRLHYSGGAGKDRDAETIPPEPA
jgi:hypothetical protein